MKVKELIDLLHTYDLDAEVYLEIEDTDSINSVTHKLREDDIEYQNVRNEKELSFVHKFPLHW